MSNKVYKTTIKDLKKKIEECCSENSDSIALVTKNETHSNCNVKVSSSYSFKNLVDKIKNEVVLNDFAVVTKDNQNIKNKKNKP